MEASVRKKRIAGMTYLFALSYVVINMTRNSYGAVISEMETATGTPRDLLSMAVTGGFIACGFGQLISGKMGDRFSPKKLIAGAFVLTILMNLLLPFCQSPYAMLVVWSINGLAQSFMWPPMVRLMAFHMNLEEYDNSVTTASYGGSVGSILLYIIAPIVIAISNWKGVFFVSAAAALVMLFVWLKYAPDTDPENCLFEGGAIPPKGEVTPSKGRFAPLFTPLVFSILLAILCQGILRDGIVTWMPTYIADTYDLENEISILSGVLMPVFSLCFFRLAAVLHAKWLKNPLVCAAAFFGASALCSGILCFLPDFSPVLSIILSAVVYGCMYGINLILVCILPVYFKKTGNVSSASGLFNACAYIGSAISTCTFAVLSKELGWTFTLSTWLGITVLGTVFCCVCAKPWAKEFEE